MVKQTIQIFARVKPTKAKTGVGKLGCQLDMLWFDFVDREIWFLVAPSKRSDLSGHYGVCMYVGM